MQSRLLTQGPPRLYAVVLESGEEVVASLTRFAETEQLDASQITAIGAFDHAVLGFFDFSKRDYRKNVVDEQLELLSLIGDFALEDGKPKMHAHVTVGRSDGSTRGGHLLEARVHPTLEAMITESPGHLHRVYDPETGLALIRTGESS